MRMKADMRRARAGASYLLIAAACVGAATACGSTAVASGPAASASAPAAKVSLNITVSGKPGTAAKRWTLRCDPPGGTHPDPAAACAVLLKTKNPFAPPPKGIMCPMIIVGTHMAIVKGTFFGQHIDTTITQGGCDLAKWTALSKIFD
jgi:Subtilisin inhibitor-like